ncbi:MAG: hypothetical protein A3F82_08520 [Deltaproteobacteria bacterium RIFCSPLOWO2_12_FULL_44_12]|nr:MAG: hypothetical protein A2712_00405 [Deltaproteobacteria bacterium RIFCSPHIGHO2_01_FULL_43_49]OGQ15878.1 MAG: hypothetical protein A3D22_03055 [Deltaproteobacteria bacterium RIFCSPHIGHO2_02_FULL_44_53]OGQ28832.1 MAG: hypothetical protein A3D98_01385 [Deltaproteobacteria bacterium RIFCSPHIGHO2_12_FULL_44_21]OGQ32152.1 MAG: hypothetical protein A2979_03510 [Deltaproteobacteria bacterium RIFCSPLOWO2_01_FULL_45_74]OGQ43705.1 MAG: hypothetical protein A3I70_05480 [Deltaproteobacteria bacterium 
MPTVFKKGGYRFFFYSADFAEPKHIHVEYGNGVAKFWLFPLQLASSYGLKAHELKRARILIEEHIGLIEEKWNEFFSRTT